MRKPPVYRAFHYTLKGSLTISLDYERYLVLKRRSLLLTGGKMALFAALGGRLVQLQWLESEQYRLRADDNRISPRFLPPPRGRMLDANGVPLAENHADYQALMIPEQAGEWETVLQKASALLGLSAADTERLRRRVKQQPRFLPVLLKEHLDWQMVAALEVRLPELPGLSVESSTRRFYPFGEATAHLTGYVGVPNETDVAKGGNQLRIPGITIGKSGLERALEEELRGRSGQIRQEVDAGGRIIRRLAEQPSLSGADIPLSIDSRLQQFAFQRMGQESGSVVVLEIATGAIRALVSAPSIDPNKMVQGIGSREWQELNSDPRARHVHKAVSGLYPPGSTFKMLVALAGLENGFVHPEKAVFCPGRYRLGNRWFHCWKRGGHGWVNMRRAIFSSCDVYFYDLAHRMGGDPIMTMAKRFGLGQSHNLGFSEEKQGLLPDDVWKRQYRKRPWGAGDSLNVGIGQGDMLATPLQMAVMAARLASGKQVTPWLHGTPSAHNNDLLVPADHLQPVHDAMNDVVNKPYGTAFASRIRQPGLQMAGKTGTVQVRQISMAERARGVFKNAALPWKMRDHAMFVAFAPVNSPRYSIAVVVEHGGSGSEAAAPIARDVLTEAYNLSTAG